jgi:hypothetical protein
VTPSRIPVLESILSDGTPRTSWTLDCPAIGAVVLNVRVGYRTASNAPLHWRAGDWSKPPLDMRMSSIGDIEGVQFVFQDESIFSNTDPFPATAEVGVPVFDVHAWPDDRYLDTLVNVHTFRVPTGELCATIGEVPPKRVISSARGLRIAFAATGELAGFEVGPFSRDDWLMIEASGPPQT